MKKTFESFLPCFPGFYESVWYSPDYEADETYAAVSSAADYDFPEKVLERFLADHQDAVTYDYNAYEKDLSESYADMVSDALDEAGFPNKITFLRLDRPREYNFRTDYAAAEYEIDADALVKFCLDESRVQEFADFLEKNYGERPGFMPFHPATPEYWTDLSNNNPWTVAILVRFVLEQESGKGEDVWGYLANQAMDWKPILLGDYIQAESVLDFLESDNAGYITSEYNRLMYQGDEYLRLMGNKYTYAVKAGKEKAVSMLAAEMADLIGKRKTA